MHPSRIILALLLLAFGLRADDQALRRRDAAVAGALRYLADQQVTDGPEAGSWPTPKPEYRPAVASLAGLAFLANGHTPTEGEYAPQVRAALRYVMGTMAPDGYLGQGDRSGMYIHAMSTLFGLCCLGMTGDPEQERELTAWCQRSLDVIAQAQAVRRSPDARGGWRYTPYTSESDLSVTSWQLLVLHAARQCGYAVDPIVIDDAMRYLDSALHALPDGLAGYRYRPGVSQHPEPAVTGAAIAIRRLLSQPAPEQEAPLLRYLGQYPPSWGGHQYANYFFFASFYLTQGMFQIGGRTWDDYRARLELVLLDHQAGDGSWPFPPDNMPQSRLAGPAYPVAMAVLMLSLERQYLPMYQRQQRLY